VLDSHSRRRRLRAAFYGSLFAGGLVLVIDPTRQITLASPFIRFLWGGFLVVGGIFTIYGAIRDHWRPEWLGIPLQGSAMFAFVSILFAGGTTGQIAIGLFLTSIVVALASRFLDLVVLARLATKMRKSQVTGG